MGCPCAWDNCAGCGERSRVIHHTLSVATSHLPRVPSTLNPDAPVHEIIEHARNQLRDRSDMHGPRRSTNTIIPLIPEIAYQNYVPPEDTWSLDRGSLSRSETDSPDWNIFPAPPQNTPETPQIARGPANDSADVARVQAIMQHFYKPGLVRPETVYNRSQFLASATVTPPPQTMGMEKVYATYTRGELAKSSHASPSSQKMTSDHGIGSSRYAPSLQLKASKNGLRESAHAPATSQSKVTQSGLDALARASNSRATGSNNKLDSSVPVPVLSKPKVAKHGLAESSHAHPSSKPAITKHGHEKRGTRYGKFSRQPDGAYQIPARRNAVSGPSEDIDLADYYPRNTRGQHGVVNVTGIGLATPPADDTRRDSLPLHLDEAASRSVTALLADQNNNREVLVETDTGVTSSQIDDEDWVNVTSAADDFEIV